MSSLAPRHTFYVRSAVFHGTLVLYTKGLASIIDGGLVLTLHPGHKDAIMSYYDYTLQRRSNQNYHFECATPDINKLM